MSGQGKDCLFQCIRHFNAALTKACNEIHFDTAECGGIGILRHVKTLRAPVMMQRKFVRQKADRRPIRPIGNNARHRFDRIFEQRQTARTRPAINAQAPGLVNERQPRFGFHQLARGGDEAAKDIILTLGRNSQERACVGNRHRLERRWRHKKHRHGFPLDDNFQISQLRMEPHKKIHPLSSVLLAAKNRRRG